MLENLPVMLDALDEALNIIVWNKECERVSGYTDNEIIHHSHVSELLYPDPVYRERMQTELASRGDYRNWEWEVICKDGRVRTISWSNIFHQYNSADYQSLLADHGIRVSMSRVGNCCDNAAMESFYATLKTECVDDRVATRHLARAAIFDYIEIWYNRHRRHSSLGYLSPAAFEDQHQWDTITLH